jgi:RNA polymerase sigma factor (sigma-70 family)
MNVQINKRASNLPKDPSNTSNSELVRVIEERFDSLLTGIRVLIWKMGMAGSEKEAEELALEILNETVVTALQRESNFNPEKSAHAWLMGIGVNKIKELRTKEIRHNKRTGVVTETYQFSEKNISPTTTRVENLEQITEEDMIDYLITKNADANPIRHKIHLTFNELVSLVNPDDRLVLKLAFVDNLKGKDLAATLETSVGSASVRLSRAISRLRQAYLFSEASERSKNE